MNPLGLRGPPWLVALAIMAWEFWPKKNRLVA